MNVISSGLLAAMVAVTMIAAVPKPTYAQAVELIVVDVKAVREFTTEHWITVQHKPRCYPF